MLPKFRCDNRFTKPSISEMSPLKFLLCDKSNVRSAGTPTKTLGGSNVSYKKIYQQYFRYTI